jgi:hypothetical protein
MYTAVVRLIITYATTIWWPRVKLKTSQGELSKLQRMACLGITGAMRTAPTAAMEVHLGLPPLHLQVEAKANDQWKSKSEGFGRAYMTQDMSKEPTVQMGSDKMIPRHVYDKPFTIRFPAGNEWIEGFQPAGKGRLICYTDGSKTKALGLGYTAMERGGN